MNNNDENLIIKYVPKEKQKEALEKLATGYPVQYIIGNVEFYNLIINVNENVLIPRFETEYLVKDVIGLIKEKGFENKKMLEIGTGSGCISIAIKKNLNVDITAIDSNFRAINIAKKNAKLNDVNIKFLNESIEEYKPNEKFDVLVSNPPYVPYNSIVDDKIKYEPQDAIFAKENGLYFYRVIFKKIKELVNEKNIIALEIGDKQGEIIKNTARKVFPKANIILKKDLNGYDRYVYIINE